ncbi:hypothetical protein LguiB_015506 [Lonicera macranthoides]
MANGNTRSIWEGRKWRKFPGIEKITGKDGLLNGSGDLLNVANVYDKPNVLEAFRKAITTWVRWVNTKVNPAKSLVFFRGYVRRKRPSFKIYGMERDYIMKMVCETAMAKDVDIR